MPSRQDIAARLTVLADAKAEERTLTRVVAKVDELQAVVDAMTRGQPVTISTGQASVRLEAADVAALRTLLEARIASELGAVVLGG